MKSDNLLFLLTSFIAVLPLCSAQLDVATDLTESFQGAGGDNEPSVNGEIANCNAALPISIGGSESGTTIGDAALGSVPSCGEADSNGSGVWYTLVGNGETLLADTCDSDSGFDTVLSVFRGSCEDLECVGGNDDSCLTQSAVQWFSREDETYFIFVQGYVFSTGDFVLSIEESPVPLNDVCESAQTLSASVVNSIVFESTNSASVDEVTACGDASSAFSQGVWYTAIGTGNQFHVNTCDEETTFDTAISVYTGSCGELACVDGNDDSCGRQSSVTWHSSPGEVYYIHVKGYVGDTGTFGLEFTERIPQHNFYFYFPEGTVSADVDTEVQSFLCQVNLFLYNDVTPSFENECLYLEAIESNYEFDQSGSPPTLDVSLFISGSTGDDGTPVGIMPPGEENSDMGLGDYVGTFFDTGDFWENYIANGAGGLFSHSNSSHTYFTRSAAVDTGMISHANCPSNPWPPCVERPVEVELIVTEETTGSEASVVEEIVDEEVPGEEESGDGDEEDVGEVEAQETGDVVETEEEVTGGEEAGSEEAGSEEAGGEEVGGEEVEQIGEDIGEEEEEETAEETEQEGNANEDSGCYNIGGSHMVFLWIIVPFLWLW